MPFFTPAQNELRVLKSSEKRIIALTAFGSFFSCLDFITYITFKDILTEVFFSEKMPEWSSSITFFAVIVSGYIFRPLGGIVMANFGDLHGRKPMMMLSLLILSVSTLALALLPSYAQVGLIAPMLLIVLRLVQGFAFGGEVPASWVYLSEHLPRSHIGIGCGLLIGGFVLSVFCNSLLLDFLSAVLTNEQMLSFGWRIPFLVGGLGTALAVIVRSPLTETKVWQFAKKNQQLTKQFPLKVVLKNYHFSTFMSLALSWFSSSLFIVILMVLPSFSQLYQDVDGRVMSLANNLTMVFGAIGAVTFGYMTDRFNSGKVLIIGCIALAVSSFICYSQLQNSDEWIFLGYMMVGFCFGVIGVIPSIIVRLFPVEVRFSGVSFCYNVAYAVTGIGTPILLGYTIKLVSLAPALYVMFVCLVGALVGLFLTNLQGLHRIEAVGQDSPDRPNTLDSSIYSR